MWRRGRGNKRRKCERESEEKEGKMEELRRRKMVRRSRR